MTVPDWKACSKIILIFFAESHGISMPSKTYFANLSACIAATAYLLQSGNHMTVLHLKKISIYMVSSQVQGHELARFLGNYPR